MLLFQKLILIIKISTSQDFKSTFNYNLTCIFLSLRAKLKTPLCPRTPCRYKLKDHPLCICRNNENIEMVPGTASKAGQFQQCYTNSQGLNLFLNLINKVSTRQDDGNRCKFNWYRLTIFRCTLLFTILSSNLNRNSTYSVLCRIISQIF